MSRYLQALFLSLAVCVSPSFVGAQTGFTDIGPSIGMSYPYHSFLRMGGGISILDYDQDGWEDIYVNRGLDTDELWHNNGDGSFTEVATTAGLTATDLAWTTGTVAGDVDNDGYPDIYVTTDWGFGNILFHNNGDGTFTDIGVSAGVADTMRAFSSAFADFNKDGFLDLYIVNYVEKTNFLMDSSGTVVGFDHDCYPNRLYMNNGDNTFNEMSVPAGVADSGCGLALCLSDYDLDGDPDILVMNDFGQWVISNRIFQNEFPLPDTFSDVSTAKNFDYGFYAMGVAIGDYDHDMDLDYYETNLGRNLLLNNQAGLSFIDTTAFAGVENTFVDTLFTTGWGTAFIDYDNDMWQDLIVSNGHIAAADFIATHPDDPNKLYRNNGDGTFADVSTAMGIDETTINRGLAWLDFDKDGDQDVLFATEHEDTASGFHTLFYRNDLSNGNGFLMLDLIGTISNRDAYGAIAAIYVGGESWINEVNGGSSHLSSNSKKLHFGLGGDTLVDSLVIHWPNGLTETLTNIPANSHLTVIEDSTFSIITAEDLVPAPLVTTLRAFPNPFSEAINIDYVVYQSTPVSIVIFDQLGRAVKEIENKMSTPGKHSISWDGHLETGRSAPVGIYFIQLKSADRVQTLKVIKAK